jgi:hypothetical protein
MSEIAPFVQPKNQLYKDLKRAEIVNKIFDRLAKLPEIKSFKEDLEFLNFCCQIVEHSFEKKKYKFDKKQIVIDVFIKLFGTVNKELIEKNIQYLYDNKKIKKLGCISIWFGCLSEWWMRKVA